jgi:23S rRNA G2445 N2-methylase RlmL
MAQKYFVQITPGLEEVLKAELKILKVRKLKTLKGAVTFEGTRKHLYRVLHWSRCAHRVYWTLGTWGAPQQEAIYQKARRISWSTIFTTNCQIAIRCKVTQNTRVSSNTQVKDLILHAIRKSCSPHIIEEVEWSCTPHFDQKKIQRLLIHIEQDQLTIRLDASGGLMHKRGWRISDGPAPLRSTLVASILRLSQWNADIPLIDPMCGSGTWSLEAIQIALSVPPRLWTQYPCQQWEGFDPELWQQACDYLKTSLTQQVCSFFISDINPNMTSLTCKHINLILNHTYIAQDTTPHVSIPHHQSMILGSKQLEISFNTLDIDLLTPPKIPPGYIVLNPPYNIRIKTQWDLAQWLTKFLSNPLWHFWKVLIILPKAQAQIILKKFQGLCLAEFTHGGLLVNVLTFVN